MNTFVTDPLSAPVDILLSSETKLHKSFPIGQSKLERFNALLSLDGEINSGGVMLYDREDILAKLLTQHQCRRILCRLSCKTFNEAKMINMLFL